MKRKLFVGMFLALLGIVAPTWAQSGKVTAIRAGHLFDSKSGNMLSLYSHLSRRGLH